MSIGEPVDLGGGPRIGGGPPVDLGGGPRVGERGVPVPAAAAQVRLLLTRPAARALSGHRIVTATPDGRLDYASCADLQHLAAPLWLTLGAVAAGADGVVITHGPVTEPSWAWSPGPIFLGVDGALTQTPPAAPAAVFLAQVGAATGPTDVFIDRNPSVRLI